MSLTRIGCRTTSAKKVRRVDEMELQFWFAMMDVCAWASRCATAAYLFCVTAASDATDWSESEGRDG